MKKLLFLSTFILLIAGSMDLKAPERQIVPYSSKDSGEKVEPISKKSIMAQITPILANVGTLARSTFELGTKYSEIKQAAERLKPDTECLTNRKSDSCKGISCATVSKCTGTTLSDLLKVMFPILKAIFGSIDAEGGLTPGALFAIVDTAERIPSSIPTSLYTRLNVPPIYKTKIDGVVSKLAEFRVKLPELTRSFWSAMAMLNGVVLTLNPGKFIDTIPVKALPPIKEIENAQGLTEDVVKEIDTVLALPAPQGAQAAR